MKILGYFSRINTATVLSLIRVNRQQCGVLLSSRLETADDKRECQKPNSKQHERR
jgi:hypothetical protein